MVPEHLKSPSLETYPVLLELSKENLSEGVEHFMEWFKGHRHQIDDLIEDSGGVLLRDTYIETDGDFARFVDIAAREGTLNYVSGNSPRLKVADGIYTSTEVPADREIQIHNELSYTADWPSKIIFCSIVPAETGGETPIANCHAIYQSIPGGIRGEFEKRRIAYIRNLHAGTGMGASWQDTFETGSSEEVTNLLSRSGITFGWRPDNSLWMKEIRPAVIQHPVKGCKIWFNQVTEFHPSGNGPELYEALLDLYGNDTASFPMYAQFGDGGEIPLDYLEVIREAIKTNTIKFPWKKGDVLMLDNVLMGHGRMPYKGSRRTLVAMTR
jgi:alpha-ketoglutarate-dependent taurine dioxygenase